MKHVKKLVSWLLTAALAVGMLGAVPGMAADVHKAPVLADLGALFLRIRRMPRSAGPMTQ